MNESHSIAILEAVGRLLGKTRVDLLSAGDLWLLLETAYSHDIGMSIDYEALEKLWTEEEEFREFIKECIEDDLGDLKKAALYYREMDQILRSIDVKKSREEEAIIFEKDWPVLSQKYLQILVAEYLRKHHAENVEKLFTLMDIQKETQIPSRFYKSAILVCQMHGKSFADIRRELRYSANGFGSGSIHPQFVAAMLRIGDLLDIDNNRFNPYSIKHFGRLPFASLLHLKKHNAITHISIMEEKITVAADTEEADVALLTEDWFHYIEEEVKNLVCCWNDIVPEALQGCILQEGNCTVFYKGQKFNSDLQKVFTVNKQKLIRLLVGAKIYDSEMDFLREYLQNAMDASKMQLWIDLNSGCYEHSRNQRTAPRDINPFDLERDVYRNYAIRIRVEWNKSQDKIRLHIMDNGIGIEKEYLEGLSNIGTGWSGRKRYKREIALMPDWLRPTGGFGIGIHAAFMVTDMVTIYTHSEQNAQGFQIILKNPDSGGTVSVQKIKGYRHRGTEIVVDISPEKFQKLSEESFLCDTIMDNVRGDEFDPDNTICYVLRFIEVYLHKYIINPLFPIIIESNVSKRVEYTSSNWPGIAYWEIKKTDMDSEDVTWTGDNCIICEQKYLGTEYLCIYQPDKGTGEREQIIVWDTENSIMMNFYMDSREKQRNVCYKNVIVQVAERSELNFWEESSYCIDFMGFRVEECLVLHRGSFQKGFSINKYIRAGYNIYLSFLEWASRKEAAEETKWKSRWKNYYLQLSRLCISRGEYGEYETDDGTIAVRKFQEGLDRTEVIQEKNIVVDRVSKANVLSAVWDFFRKSVSGDAGHKAAMTPVLLIEVPYGTNPEEKIRIGNTDISMWQKGKPTGQRVEMTAILNMLTEGIGIIRDSRTSNILMHDSNLEVLCCVIPSVNIKCMAVFPKVHTEASNKKEICLTFLKGGKLSTHDKKRTYVSCGRAKIYERLWVDQLPYAYREAASDKQFLLSPFSGDSYTAAEARKNRGFPTDYEKFRELVWGKRGSENPDYRLLIGWTTKHQKAAQPCREREIKEAYEQLLKDIYEEYRKEFK